MVLVFGGMDVGSETGEAGNTGDGSKLEYGELKHK